MAENIKEILIDAFRHDPLYRMVIDSKLEGYLFPDSLLEIDTKKTYSTIEVGKIIGRKDSTIRNYFKTELLDYINPEKVGNTYRLDYMNIFKIHMISLLFEKGRKNKSEIAYELGLKSGVKLGTDDAPKFIKRQNQEIEKIQQFLTYMTKVVHQQTKLNKELHDLEKEKHEKNLEKVELEHQVKMLEREHVEEKYFNAIQVAVEELSEMENKNAELIQELKERRSIFNLFTKKENKVVEKVSLTNPAERISKALKTAENQKENIKSISEIREDINKLENEIKNIEKQISEKLLKLEQSNNLLDQPQSHQNRISEVSIDPEDYIEYSKGEV